MPPQFSQNKNKPEEAEVDLKKSDSLPPIRTYKGDIEDLLKRGKTSTVTIAMAEDKRRIGKLLSTTEEEERLARSGSRVAIIAAIILIFAGLTILGWFVFIRKTPIQTVPAYIASTIITADQSKEIAVDNLTRRSFIDKIIAEKNTLNITLGSVAEFILTKGKAEEKKRIDTSTFMTILQTQAPSSLERSLAGEFVFGLHSGSGGYKPFIIFKTDSFQETFASMLNWETTLPNDLGPIFLSGDTNQTNNLVATTTETKMATSSETGATNGNFHLKWSDAVLRNKDARVVKDQNGQIVLLYSFVDQKTLIITTNENTLKELMDRLRTAALVR